MAVSTHSYPFDLDLGAKLRALGVKWTITDEGVIHLAVPPKESTRQTVNKITAFYPSAAVVRISKNSAEIQL